MVIAIFKDNYRWLSNFWKAPVELDGVWYPTVEHAYQAAKSTDPIVRHTFESGTAGDAKRMGKRVRVRSDWNDVKLSIMEKLVRQKFILIPELKARLLATGDQLIEEGNFWHDQFWGICRCVNCRNQGINHLGRIIMKVRDELRGSHKATPLCS
jgi:ribA/ribD-fused uncharacterized protein